MSQMFVVILLLALEPLRHRSTLFCNANETLFIKIMIIIILIIIKIITVIVIMIIILLLLLSLLLLLQNMIVYI